MFTDGSHDHDCGCHEPTQATGTTPPRGNKPKTVVKIWGGTFRAQKGVEQIDNLSTDLALVQLPQNPNIGDDVSVNAVKGQINVEGGAADILGQDGVTGLVNLLVGENARFQWTSGCVWTVLKGDAANEEEELRFDNIAALVAFDSTGTPSGTRALLVDLDQDFELDPTSTAAPDGITIVPATAGNWLRIEGFSKKWSTLYQNKNLAVSGASATAPIVLTTTVPHGLAAGDAVFNSGIAGLSAANGAFKVTPLTATTFSLNGSSGVGQTYLSGGTVGTGVQIDPVLGSDENDGLHAASALKSVAESCRRLHQAAAGRNYLKLLLGDVPLVEATLRPYAGPTATPPAGATGSPAGVLVSDRWRASYIYEANAETLLTNGDSQQINEQLIGQLVPQAGTYVASASTLSSGNLQATITSVAFLGAEGDMIRVVNDPVTPANNGAVAFVGAVLGGGVFRITDPYTPSGATIGTAIGAGTTFEKIVPTAWAPAMSQPVDSRGRYQIEAFDFVFTAGQTDLAPIQLRMVASFIWSRCRFERPVSCNQLVMNQNACFYNFPALSLFPGSFGAGSAGMTIVFMNDVASITLAACGFLHTQLVWNNGMRGTLTSIYFEKSILTNKNINPFTTFGAPVGANAGSAARQILTGGNGVRFFDWPVVAANENAALLIRGGTIFQALAGTIGGSSAIANSIGVVVENGSQLQIQETLTVSDATWIQGATAAVRIRNPGGLASVAVRFLANPIVAAAAAITLESQTLETWDNWAGAGAGQFTKAAWNPLDGSSIRSSAA